MNQELDDDRGLFDALVDDGRPLIKLTGLALIGSGLFAFFLGATGHFLPHDIAHLGMTAEQLRGVADSRLVYFMIHDRVSFGGAILGVGVLYLWLAEFPLRQKCGWAWWTLAVSGILGFGSFLTYLGYGYLDTWHGVATLVLLPTFGLGMIRSAATLDSFPAVSSLFPGDSLPTVKSKLGVGRLLLLITGFCLAIGGLVILTVGMTTVFVPQDLDYMGLTAADLESANPRLVPLIAHDRAGFGGGVCCCGVTMFFCVLCGTPSRSLWQALLLMGIAGFGSAIGVHFPIGYTNVVHLAPAFLGVTMYIAGMSLSWDGMIRRAEPDSA